LRVQLVANGRKRLVKPNNHGEIRADEGPRCLMGGMERGPLDRRDLRTRSGRAASELRRALGAELKRSRLDSGLSLRALARAADIAPSHLSEVERGIAEPSLAVLASLAGVLGADVSIRLFPGTGPRIRDRLQAPIVEALIREAHMSWKRLVEVTVWRPVRGVIDAVVSRPGEVVVAIEVHSEIRRLEQQIRWAREKSEALPSAEAWSMLLAGAPTVPVSRMLVLRSTRANRELVNAFESTFRAAYPARAADAVRALRDPTVPWPGPVLIWARTAAGVATILDRPPRSVAVGR
jgi:transcriptional regulator with XRE-family HTH domain